MMIRSTSNFREFANELSHLAQHGIDLSQHPGVTSLDAALKSLTNESAMTINLLLDTIEEQNRALVALRAHAS
ncbi:hypothetical protein A8H39_01155 [Paraburkholderia fungorum]|uniref:hypothetical protein n=1 Tax=Paraburkholderia fungorum TaxID=134537 RepID=UPI000485AC62|nr:hypothetical protein [Paraburkholderia fungorum]PNE59784.1 hypothetical protein A8H39_01155 [Paraburkholderia fungorum]